MTCRFPRPLHGGQDQQDKARSPAGRAETAFKGGGATVTEASWPVVRFITVTRKEPK